MKERSGEGRGRTEWGFLGGRTEWGLGGVFILQQLFLVPRGPHGEGGATVACNGMWHLLTVWQEGINCVSSLSFYLGL